MIINSHHHVPDSPSFPAGPDTATDGMDSVPYARLWMGTWLRDATLFQEAMATIFRVGLGRVQLACRSAGAEVTWMAGQLMLTWEEDKQVMNAINDGDGELLKAWVCWFCRARRELEKGSLAKSEILHFCRGRGSRDF
jgi:hypothetical protein